MKENQMQTDDCLERAAMLAVRWDVHPVYANDPAVEAEVDELFGPLCELMDPANPIQAEAATKAMLGDSMSREDRFHHVRWMHRLLTESEMAVLQDLAQFAALWRYATENKMRPELARLAKTAMMWDLPRALNRFPALRERLIDRYNGLFSRSLTKAARGTAVARLMQDVMAAPELWRTGRP